MQHKHIKNWFDFFKDSVVADLSEKCTLEI